MEDTRLVIVKGLFIFFTCIGHDSHKKITFSVLMTKNNILFFQWMVLFFFGMCLKLILFLEGLDEDARAELINVIFLLLVNFT